MDIKEYADAVEPGILNALLYEASEFIETQSFSILPRRDAMRALELQRDQLIASDDVVATQVAEMDVALNELGDGQFCMGEYHYSLVVFGDDVADAGRRAASAIGAVGEASSLQMSPIDLVADAAWFAHMPGNWPGPYGIEQFVLGHQPIALLDQGQQQVESARTEPGLLSVDEQLSPQRTDFKAAKAMNGLQRCSDSKPRRARCARNRPAMAIYSDPRNSERFSPLGNA